MAADAPGMTVAGSLEMLVAKHQVVEVLHLERKMVEADLELIPTERDRRDRDA